MFRNKLPGQVTTFLYKQVYGIKMNIENITENKSAS